MNIEKLDNVQIVKLILSGERITQKALCEKIGQTSPNFSHSIHKNRLRVEDLQKICDILGYELLIKKKSN